MTYAVYYRAETLEAHTLLSGPDLAGFPPPTSGDLAVLVDGPVTLPGHVAQGIYVQRPPAPSPAHTWDWPSKSWVLPLSAAKDAKWAEVKAARDAREFGIFRWNGYDFDGDEQAQRRLNLAVLAAQAALMAGSPWSIDWTLFDNSTKTLSAADMIGVVEALGANIAAAHEAARAKRTLIEAATTVQQLDAI